jgi:hypothetical protein
VSGVAKCLTENQPENSLANTQPKNKEPKRLTPSSAAPERSEGHQQRSCWRQLQRNVRLGREGRVLQVHYRYFRFQCSQRSGKRHT